MSCTDPIVSFDGLIRRVVRYADGCGSIGVAEADTLDPLACPGDIPDLVLAAMAFAEGSSLFRVATTNVAIADLCDDYQARQVCVGESLAQVMREAITKTGDVTTINVLYVTDADGSCMACPGDVQLEELMVSTVVTDGAQTYLLAIAPPDDPDPLDCITGEIQAETLTRSAISDIGSCGMRAWMVEYGALGGDFNDDFSNDFNIQ